MRINKYCKTAVFLTALALSACLLVSGCTNLRPLEPQSPGKQTGEANNYVVTYNYGSTDKVQLSANNLTLKVGQKLTLQPAPGLTQNTRFTSSGENFFGDVMQQDPGQDSSKATFTAIKPGKGRLQIIPNTDQVDRAVDLWVTVE